MAGLLCRRLYRLRFCRQRRCCWWPRGVGGGRWDRLLLPPYFLRSQCGENVRGQMISMYQLMHWRPLGIVLAFLSDTAFSYSGDWRSMLGVLAPAVILIVLVVFCLNQPA